MQAASPLSNALSAIIHQHHYQESALQPCIDLLGDSKRDEIAMMLRMARDTLRYYWHGDFLKFAAAHSRYCDLFSSLCGYPGGTREAMAQMIKDSQLIAEITHHYGWMQGRMTAYLAGELNAYLDHGAPKRN